nr:MAG TPA: hypothetical protein [Caudoviricetes sp.]
MSNEELKKEIEQLQQKITELRFKILESEADKKPYEVKVPEDIENYYYVDELGDINLVGDTFHETDYEGLYLRGLAFKTREEAEKFDKERILINRAKNWAKKYDEGWTPNWNDYKEEKWTVMYHNECEEFEIYENYRYREFLKLPYFESEEIAELFIKEFGDEIKEVLC